MGQWLLVSVALVFSCYGNWHLRHSLQEAHRQLEQTNLIISSAEDGKWQQARVSNAVAALSILLFSLVVFHFMESSKTPSKSDFRRYIQELMTCTIAGFAAMILVASLHEVVEAKGVVGSGLHLLFWTMLFHLSLLVKLGIFDRFTGSQDPDDLDSQDLVEQEAGMKFYGVIFAYAAGFAAPDFWDAIREEYFVPRAQSGGFLWLEGEAFMWLLIPSAGLVFFLTSQMWHLLEATLLGIVDHEPDEKVEKVWVGVLHDGEEHMVSFTLSHLVVQQALKHVVDDEPADQLKMIEDTKMLSFAALVFLAFASGIVLLLMKLPPRFTAPNLMSNLMTTAYMGCAWCLLHAGRVVLHNYAPLSANNGLVLAVVVSLVIMLLGYILFKIARSGYLGDGGYKILVQLANGLCIAAPIAWGRCFMRITDTIANQTTMKYAEVLLNLVCIVLLLPAWRYHLLPYARYRYGFLKDNALMEDTAKHRVRLPLNLMQSGGLPKLSMRPADDSDEPMHAPRRSR